MKRGFGGIMSSEQAGGHHCLLLIGGQGTPPSIQLPQPQYFQYRDGRVRTNEQNIYDLTRGKYINIIMHIIILYYQILLITVSVITCNCYCYIFSVIVTLSSNMIYL